MSPRLHGVRERRPHDFGLLLPLAFGKRHPLITHETLELDIFPTNQPSASSINPNGIMMHEGVIVIVDVAIDRSDVAVDIEIGNKSPYTVCGPWARGHVFDLASIFLDMKKEERHEEAKGLAAELKELVQHMRGLWIPLVVPVRMYCQAYARLLPNAPEGFAQIHLRTLITVDVQ
jgi:hypothetical protein